MNGRLKINIVLPFLQKDPGGGLKVMYQYANQFAGNGHDVVIYHSMYTSWTQTVKVYRKSKHFFYQKYLNIVRKRRPKWFELNPLVKSFEIVEVDDAYIRDADIVFCTWWATALEINLLNDSKGKKYNLIQDYEAIMTTHTDLVHKSYHLNMQHIAVSNYLANLVGSISQKQLTVIPNTIDPAQFFIETPVEERNPLSVCMLYSDSARKGSIYGIEALKIVIKRYPALVVNLFGVYQQPKYDLPANFQYHYLPDNLRKIYNDSAIFITPSIHEGWGLPPMEAMSCGCACVCTNIEGHLDFMSDQQTALLVQPANPGQMAEKIIALIEDVELRVKLAYSGNNNIQQFSWRNSLKKMMELLYKGL